MSEEHIEAERESFTSQPSSKKTQTSSFMKRGNTYLRLPLRFSCEGRGVAHNILSRSGSSECVVMIEFVPKAHLKMHMCCV